MRGCLKLVVLWAVTALVPVPAQASHYPLANVLPADAAEKLAKAGLRTTSDLLDQGANPADRARLAKLTGLAEKQLKEWVQMCDLVRIQGVGPVMVRLLATVKITSVALLAKQKAAALYPRVMQANDKAKVTQNPPSEKHLEHWIEQAKKLKVVVR
ncbi:MAG: DUF4332 domain-containing protein [Deltaproteobacteria bacterium]|nr:DUF4332 domain-containing protein [Deltaproteobacteria bacterium]